MTFKEKTNKIFNSIKNTKIIEKIKAGDKKTIIIEIRGEFLCTQKT